MQVQVGEKGEGTDETKKKAKDAESDKNSNKGEGGVDGKLPKKRVYGETIESDPQNADDGKQGATTASESAAEKNPESDSKKRRKTD